MREFAPRTNLSDRPPCTAPVGLRFREWLVEFWPDAPPDPRSNYFEINSTGDDRMRPLAAYADVRRGPVVDRYRRIRIERGRPQRTSHGRALAPPIRVLGEWVSFVWDGGAEDPDSRGLASDAIAVQDMRQMSPDELDALLIFR